MQKWKKISLSLAIGAVAFTAVYYGALYSLPNIIDLNKYKETISKEIEKETGFKVDCENITFKRSLTPYLKINMFHTIVLYPNSEIFLKLKEVDLNIKLLPLAFKKIIIKDAKLSRPIINITLYKDFSTSLERYIDTKKIINTNGFKFDSLIYDTLCERYKIKFNDETTNKTFYLEGDELLLKDIKLNETAHFVLKGALYEGNTEYIKYDIDAITPLKANKAQFTFSPFKPLLESNIKGNVLGHVIVDKENNINGEVKIDNLSLKIEDIVSSNNNANLKFKGQEVDINANLHTSKTDSAKINGKFKYGKKKYIDLSTDAKNINIENLIKIISEVSEVLNIKNPVNNIDIKGILDANFTINSDFKKLKSSGNAKIINAKLKHKLFPYEITEINSSVNLDNNRIDINSAKANINQTPINVDGIIKEDLSINLNVTSNDLDLKTIVAIFLKDKKIPFEIKNGKISFTSKINGYLNSGFSTNCDVILSNINLLEKNTKIPIKLNKATSKIELKNNNKFDGNASLENLEIIINKKPITANNLILNFDDKNINVNKTNVRLLSSPIEIEGSFKDYMTNPTINILFDGNITSENLAKILSEQINLPYKAVGEIKTSGYLYASKDSNSIKIRLKANKDNYLSYLVIKELLNEPSILNIDSEIKNKELNIKNLSLTNENSTKKILNVAGSINLEENNYFKDLKINIPDSLTMATNFIGGEEFSLKGNLILNKTTNNPEIRGNLKVLYYRLKKYLTEVKNADISFSKDNIRLIAPDVTVNDSSMNIIADIVPTLNLKDIIISNIQINAPILDVNSLFEIFSNEEEKENKITIKKGFATVNNIKILDLKANDISSDISIENNSLKLKNIYGNAYGGSIEGNAEYEFKNKNLKAKISGFNVDIKNTLYDLCKIDDNISGRANFKTLFSLTNGEYNDVLKSLSGTLDFSATNGKMGTLGKFEYYLYAQNLLYHGLLNATLNRIADAIVHNNTSHYREASGNIFFQNGYLITDRIQTSGNSMSLFLKGRHNLITNQANIDIYGRISDEVKYKLGSFGNISISELVTGNKEKKTTILSTVPNEIINKIPELYNQSTSKTNTFKVNIYGKIDALNAINSFEWITSDTSSQKSEDETPNFLDLMKIKEQL